MAGSDFLARGGHVNAAWDGESGRYDLTLTLNAALQTLSITPNRVVYTQTFDGVAEGQLPQGWSLTAAEVWTPRSPAARFAWAPTETTAALPACSPP